MKPQLQYSSFEKKLFLVIAIFSVLILTVGILLINRTTTTGQPVDKEQTAEILRVKNDDWTKGSPESPITIVEYLDFECEACRVYYQMTKQLSEQYKDKVRFVVRYFPLPNHKNSLTSALAVEAAGRQGKFWEMHDILYENQTVWGEKQFSTPEVFVEYANKIELDMERYKKDIAGQELKDRINRDKNSAISLGIQGTPTFFINGEKIPNPKGLEDFKSIIDGLMPANK